MRSYIWRGLIAGAIVWTTAHIFVGKKATAAALEYVETAFDGAERLLHFG